MFVERNVGNQFQVDDLNARTLPNVLIRSMSPTKAAETVVSYATENLGVSHLLLVGHTGCGACIASIASPADAVDQDIGATRVEVPSHRAMSSRTPD
jgi:carbonic anhydrase